MDALECLQTRRSCRAFTDVMPPREVIETICRAGTFAPTGRGSQSPLIVAVTNKEVRDRLMRLNADIMHGSHGDWPDPFYGAPVVLLVLSDSEVPTHFHDGCSVIANLLNAAHACGLGSCWIHRAKEEAACAEGRALLRELGVADRYVGVDHVVVGYAAKPAAPAAPRKADYVRWVE